MTGFYISNILRKSTLLESEKDEIFEEMNHDQYIIMRSTTKKFANDKLFTEDDSYILILEGVILNLSELKDRYGKSDTYELLKEMFKKNGHDFINELIGNYAGAFYEKANDTWIVFANQNGSKMIFYYADEQGRFIIAPMASYITEILKAENIPYSFNRDAAYLIMAYGMIGTKDDTFVKEIKRIGAGELLKISGGKAEMKIYHRYRLNVYDLSNATEEEIIDGIDQRFKRAIKREYDKDLEYGYNTHLRALTGGTDSRAAAFVSHSLGYTDTVNYTFGAIGCVDEVIARQVATGLENNIIFMSSTPDNKTNKGMHDIDRIVYKYQGLAYYLHGSALPKPAQLNPSEYGLMHNSPMSESVLTTDFLGLKLTRPLNPLRPYSDKLLEKFPREHLNEFENEFIYCVYTLYFYRYLIITGFGKCDYSYPCLDVDLIDYCLSIPVAMRERYYIYHKWLFTKYPDAKKYKLEKLNARIDDNRLKKWWGKITRYGSISQYYRCSNNPFPKRIRETFELDKKIKPSPVALFPFDYWYENDVESREYMDNYFYKHLDQEVIDDELRADLKFVYENDRARAKSMAITVLAAAKLFFK